MRLKEALSSEWAKPLVLQVQVVYVYVNQTENSKAAGGHPVCGEGYARVCVWAVINGIHAWKTWLLTLYFYYRTETKHRQNNYCFQHDSNIVPNYQIFSWLSTQFRKWHECKNVQIKKSWTQSLFFI